MTYGNGANWNGNESPNGKVIDSTDSLFGWFAAWFGDFWRWLF